MYLEPGEGYCLLPVLKIQHLYKMCSIKLLSSTLHFFNQISAKGCKVPNHYYDKPFFYKTHFKIFPH